MSKLFGPMRQAGYVVRDIEKAMLHWSNVCAVGPWFYNKKAAFSSVTYKRKDCSELQISMAFANSGDIQIELIQQRCSTPSMYLEFLASGKEGMQHWSAWPENYHEVYRLALEKGFTVWQEGTHPRGPFAYFRSQAGQDPVIEISELTPGRRGFFDMVREAAANWDGRDPIRPI